MTTIKATLKDGTIKVLTIEELFLPENKEVTTESEDWTDEMINEAIEKFSFEDWNFSPSSLKKYQACPHSWALHYICKMKGFRTFAGTLIGQVFHEMVEEGYLEDPRLTTESGQAELKKEIFKRYNKKILEVEEKGIILQLPKPYTDANKKMYQDGLWRQYIIESKVTCILNFLMICDKSYDIKKRELTVEYNELGFPIKGHVDFVCDITFGDYKTMSCWRFFKIEDHLLQMGLYALALEMRQCDLLCFAHSEKREIHRIKRIIFKETGYSPISLEQIKQEAIRLHQGITMKYFPKLPGSVNWGKVDVGWCQNVCGFRKHCWGI